MKDCNPSGNNLIHSNAWNDFSSSYFKCVTLHQQVFCKELYYRMCIQSAGADLDGVQGMHRQSGAHRNCQWASTNNWMKASSYLKTQWPKTADAAETAGTRCRDEGERETAMAATRVRGGLLGDGEAAGLRRRRDGELRHGGSWSARSGRLRERFGAALGLVGREWGGRGKKAMGRRRWSLAVYGH